MKFEDFLRLRGITSAITDSEFEFKFRQKMFGIYFFRYLQSLETTQEDFTAAHAYLSDLALLDRIAKPGYTYARVFNEISRVRTFVIPIPPNEESPDSSSTPTDQPPNVSQPPDSSQTGDRNVPESSPRTDNNQQDSSSGSDNRDNNQPPESSPDQAGDQSTPESSSRTENNQQDSSSEQDNTSNTRPPQSASDRSREADRIFEEWSRNNKFATYQSFLHKEFPKRFEDVSLPIGLSQLEFNFRYATPKYHFVQLVEAEIFRLNQPSNGYHRYNWGIRTLANHAGHWRSFENRMISGIQNGPTLENSEAPGTPQAFALEVFAARANYEALASSDSWNYAGPGYGRREM